VDALASAALSDSAFRSPVDPLTAVRTLASIRMVVFSHGITNRHPRAKQELQRKLGLADFLNFWHTTH
jgi:hypothetical protein